MESNPAVKPKPAAFQVFEAFTKRIMSIPKTEIDRRSDEYRKQRAASKKKSR